MTWQTNLGQKKLSYFRLGRSRWEEKYLRFEGQKLCMYDQEPSEGLKPVTCLDLCSESHRIYVVPAVELAEVSYCAESDLPFVFKVCKVVNFHVFFNSFCLNLSFRPLLKESNETTFRMLEFHRGYQLAIIFAVSVKYHNCLSVL